MADILEINDKSLRYFLYSTNKDNFYSEFKLKKRNGGERIILAPIIELKQIQRKMAHILNLIYKPKICRFCSLPQKYHQSSFVHRQAK